MTKILLLLGAVLLAVSAHARSGDPNESSGRNRGGTEAGTTSSRHSDPSQMRDNTSGRYRDNQGYTRDAKTNRTIDPDRKERRRRD